MNSSNGRWNVTPSFSWAQVQCESTKLSTCRFDSDGMVDVEEGVGPEGETIVGIFVTDVKNEHSERVILVHPRLIELGFLDYVRARRKKGAKQLFDLPKGGSKKLSEQVNKYLDKAIVDDRRYVFHSLRHEFADRSEINISVEVARVQSPGPCRQKFLTVGPRQYGANGGTRR